MEPYSLLYWPKLLMYAANENDAASIIIVAKVEPAEKSFHLLWAIGAEK